METPNSQMLETLNTATIGTSYNVRTLSAFKGVDLEGSQFLVRKVERGTGKDSKGAIIPALSPDFIVSALDSDVVMAGYGAWLQGVAEECCKARITAGATVLVEADWSLAELEAWLTAQDIKEGRVSKEKIAAWFDYSVAAVLKSAFKAKLGGSLSDEKLAQILASYKTAFVLLAKRELTLEATVQANLEKAVALLPAGAMTDYCAKKLEGSKAKVEDMLAL